MITCNLDKEDLFTNSSEAMSLQKKSFFGERIDDRVKYSFVEGLFLFEKGKIEIFSKGKKLGVQEVREKFKRFDKKFSLKYALYKDLRKKGYIVKTGLKFGADFRVYEKGKNPENSHAKWLAFVEHETSKNSWQDFSAKNRVAHSTKKKLLLAVVDEQEDVLYYEIGWIKP